MGGRGEKMNIFYSLVLVGLGSFLMALTINNFGNTGNMLLKVIGFILMSIGFIYIIKGKSNRRG